MEITVLSERGALCLSPRLMGIDPSMGKYLLGRK
jgi:hypothetical protein